MDADATVGFFGKLPCRGDFLKRRVSDDFVSAWDEWLQQCIAESRRDLGEPWLDAYLASPIWRFVLSEGVCGSGAYAGVLMPSVDRVGRYFPMTIVAQWEPAASAIDVACGARAWFEAIETIAAEALETSDLDEFDAKVARAASLIQTGGIGESAWLRDVLGRADFPHGFTQWHAPLVSANSLQRAVNAFAIREMERTLRPLSLWWSDGSDGVAPSWLCARGLPVPKSFAAMLSGRWDGPAWRSVAPEGTQFESEPTEEGGDLAMRITASHEPVTREWGATLTTTHFVLRPEIGLWGVTANQAIADALHGVEDASSLTVIAERVRTALEAVQRQLANSTSDESRMASIGTIVFVARGTDCALVFSGPAQAIRCRGSQAVAVVGIADDWDDDDLIPSREPCARAPIDSEVELIDLITGTLTPSGKGHIEIDVRYDSLSDGQRWLIAATPLFTEAGLDRIAAAVAVEETRTTVALDAVRAECAATAGVPPFSSNSIQGATPLPVLLLAVARE